LRTRFHKNKPQAKRSSRGLWLRNVQGLDPERNVSENADAATVPLDAVAALIVQIMASRLILDDEMQSKEIVNFVSTAHDTISVASPRAMSLDGT
jgi:hypothetical protein